MTPPRWLDEARRPYPPDPSCPACGRELVTLTLIGESSRPSRGRVGPAAALPRSRAGSPPVRGPTAPARSGAARGVTRGSTSPRENRRSGLIYPSDLSSDLATRKIGGVDIGVRVGAPENPEEIREASRRDALRWNRQDVRRGDRTGDRPASGRTGGFAATTTEERDDIARHAGLSEVNVGRRGGTGQGGEGQGERKRGPGCVQ